MTPMMAASAMLCQMTNRKMSASVPTRSVAAVATQMLCASIILPITPPVEFAVAIKIGLSPSCSAVIFCRLPNSALLAASVPVRNTPSQPRTARRRKARAHIGARAIEADNAAKLWAMVTGLAAAGASRTEIAKQAGGNYMRVTSTLWHVKYDVGAIPRMPESTKAKKDAAQARYEADVAAKKA